MAFAHFAPFGRLCPRHGNGRFVATAPASARRGAALCASEQLGGHMAGEKVTVEQLPNGKWACFLHLEGVDQPINLGREFKKDEQAENWLNVSESVTAIEMMVRKHKK
jgi:hypothetical protein